MTRTVVVRIFIGTRPCTGAKYVSETYASPAAYLPAGPRIDLVGKTVFGEHYRLPMSDAMGIRMTLFWKLRKGESRRNVDAELIQLLDAQCDATALRGLEIAALRRLFLAERKQS